MLMVTVSCLPPPPQEMGVASCVHLQYIGTAAGMQGRGLGGQMMRHLW